MPALDGLRGLAIALVVFCHANLFTEAHLLDGSTFDRLRSFFLNFGWIGVDLFFVLSGFLITGILLTTKESPNYFRSFFARRFLRIFPLYYVYVIAVLIEQHTWYNRQDIASLLFYFYNLRVLHLGHPLPWVVPMWSLAIEEQFYLVWPFVVYWLRPAALKQVCLWGMVAALALRLWVLPHPTGVGTAYLLTPCRMDDLFAGALLAIWRSEPVAWKQVQRFSTRVALFSGAGLIAIALWTGHFLNYISLEEKQGLRHSSILILGPGLTLLALLFAALVSKCTQQGRLYNVFLNWPLRRMGKYSYGMYMLHWLVLHFVMTIGRHLPPMMRYPLNSWTLVSLTFAGTFVGAFLSFHLFEKHFLKLKRLFPAV
jgi:peptidoglycan/LPS O-acetylase OafA/YrhL